jgi:hypothetical protein
MDVLPFQTEVLAAGSRALKRFSRVENSREEGPLHHENELPFVVLGHWLGSILVATPVLKVTLKIHYSLPLIQQDWLELRRNQLESAGRGFVIREFGKEFANWWAGDLKNSLDPGGSASSMGLPMISRGFDELYSRKSNARDCHFSAMRIVGPNQGSLWISSLLELKNPKDFADWSWERTTVHQQSEGSGEVEFL